jgi:nicotinate-nucleotide adenylyltransferase
MKKTLPAVGLLGGTFDPIHLGHLHLAQVVYEQLQLREVRFIPNYQPLLRNQPVASAQDRLTMVRLAIKNHPQFLVDEREIKQQGPSYSIDTLKSLRTELGNVSLCFIMAIDQFKNFAKWRQWQDIPDFAHLIVTTRTGFTSDVELDLCKLLDERQTEDLELLHNTPAGYIYLLDIKPLSISGTSLRQQLKQGNEPKHSLPDSVWEYICKKNLYR